ncbi:MAG: hypothetical protein PUE93_01020, partial [Acidaminococcus sp.]|nr:hypothetical protein [Acidaminococcus sp.]
NDGCHFDFLLFGLVIATPSFSENYIIEKMKKQSNRNKLRPGSPGALSGGDKQCFWRAGHRPAPAFLKICRWQILSIGV